MSSVHRILDANANRAREALRVMEEAARFILEDAALAAAIKHARHDLAAALSSITDLELHRDTPGDVGTAITTKSEQSRASAADVAIAAGKRLSEALRAIEEYGKIIDPAFAAGVEQLRYRGYDLEQRLNRAMVGGKARQWRLCVLITESLCSSEAGESPGTPVPGDWFSVATSALEAGADCIQLREKALDAGELLERAKRLVKLCRAHGASLIINDRPDIALLAGADGVHLGQTDLPCAQVRKLAGKRLLIGVSTSRLDEAKQALADGADYCGVGPMFDTTTKQKPFLAGPDYLRAFVQWGKLPHLAIGGINPDNVHQLIPAGARGIAVSSAICCAPDPAAATIALLAEFPVDSR